MNKFTSNIKCDACIAKVTPTLNEVVGEGKWSVDTSTPSKVLTIETDASAEKINEALNPKGYRVSQV